MSSGEKLAKGKSKKAAPKAKAAAKGKRVSSFFLSTTLLRDVKNKPSCEK